MARTSKPPQPVAHPFAQLLRWSWAEHPDKVEAADTCRARCASARQWATFDAVFPIRQIMLNKALSRTVPDPRWVEDDLPADLETFKEPGFVTSFLYFLQAALPLGRRLRRRLDRAAWACARS
jgi:hypothetical protein